MALKELLVHLNHTEEAIRRLRLATDLACRHGCRLTALFVDEWNISQIDQRPTAELEGGVHTAGRRLRRELERNYAERGLEFEWQYVRDFSDTAVRKAALYADLCVLGHEGASNVPATDLNFCAKVVTEVGTPLLFIPKSTELDTLGRRIVIAWDASRAAARAVNDALPLIEHAADITLLNVDSGLHEQCGTSLSRLAERLRRHGPPTQVLQIELPAHRSIGDALQCEARKLGADLVVAGAFGHSRMTERLFGGVTRDLLERMSIPLLLTH